MTENLAERLDKIIENLPENFPERFERLEEATLNFMAFLTDWLLITVQLDREKYIQILGKEKFEELRRAITEFAAKIAEVRRT